MPGWCTAIRDGGLKSRQGVRGWGEEKLEIRRVSTWMCSETWTYGYGCMGLCAGEGVRGNNSYTPKGNVLYLFQNGRCRRINECLHKRINSQGDLQYERKKNSNMLLVLLSDFFSSFVTFALSIILFNTSHSISDNIQITNLCFSNSLKGILFTCLVNCFSFFLGTFRVFFFSQRWDNYLIECVPICCHV